ncbi:MAG: leucine-rich repeat domain-containing protein [Ruminococcaceae bacterium]|nr:leucine-rich repeat domain-containing protein [Oscillospiraceae bacterium]
MKKRVFWALIILAFVVAVTMTAIISVTVAKRSQPKPNGEENNTQIGTLEGPSHLSPSETTEQSESESTEHTSEQTSSQEETSEVTTQMETTVQEETTEPAPSLEYESFGNGTCAVVGIGTYTDSYLTIPEKSPEGHIVIAISEKAFYGNSFIRAIEIPSTVSSIGDLAFAGCSQLVYLSVDDKNMMFTDVGGVLYNIDESMLICYPSASSSATLEISNSVTTICSMAFYGCENLKQINYSGSIEDWEKIEIREKNYGLYTAAMSFGK